MSPEFDKQGPNEWSAWYWRSKAAIKIFETNQTRLEAKKYFPPDIIVAAEEDDLSFNSGILDELLTEHYAGNPGVSDLQLAVLSAKTLLFDIVELERMVVEQMGSGACSTIEEALLLDAQQKVAQMDDAFVEQMVNTGGSDHPS
ncbi:MAG TPA: hypothetical protein VLE69_01755 [Candidatus Saccharimonadales bacterium]|nr:hypothetical protein [Candidatus Saccharimonadales bacterium]